MSSAAGRRTGLQLHQQVSGLGGRKAHYLHRASGGSTSQFPQRLSAPSGARAGRTPSSGGYETTYNIPANALNAVNRLKTRRSIQSIREGGQVSVIQFRISFEVESARAAEFEKMVHDVYGPGTHAAERFRGAGGS